MRWRRGAALVFAGFILMACGSRVAPSAHSSPTTAAASAPRISEQTPGAVATVTCSGGPGSAMIVVARQFVYDVADPVHPRLICRSANTAIHVIDGNAIAYTTAVAGHVVIIRRDLNTGSESRIAQLRVEPQPYYYATAGWTWDGSLEVYSTSVPRANGTSLVSVHLLSNGIDHVLYSIDSGPGGLESRWSPRPVLAFSPDQAYVAISDFPFFIYGTNIRIFSVADQTQKFITGGSSSGGIWISNNRFAWATYANSGSLMHWTAGGGAQLIRSEAWYGATSSPDGLWLAGTLITDVNNPRVLIARDDGGAQFTTALGSNPGFVTSTVVWYAEEGPDTSGSYQCSEPCMHPTVATGAVRAFDVRNGSDVAVRFRAGEDPRAVEGYTICCATRG